MKPINEVQGDVMGDIPLIFKKIKMEGNFYEELNYQNKQWECGFCYSRT